MQPIHQDSGLAQILTWNHAGEPSHGDKLAFAALASSLAASPLVAISYRAKSPSILGSAAAVAAAGLAYQALPSSVYSTRALSPAATADAKEQPTPLVGLDLKPLLRVFHPWTVLKMLAKNVGVQVLMRLNLYLYVQHEREALAAEQEGIPPPPPPELPDLKPAVVKGLGAFGREFAIAAIRETYGCIARWRLGPDRSQALLRNNKLWIRDVLSVKYFSASRRRRFVAYQFATMHAVTLQYAADCTVSVVQHTYRTVKRQREDNNKRLGYWLLYWGKGVVLQVCRCGIIVVASSLGAALGSLVSPGRGTLVGQTLMEVVMMMAMSHAIDSLMD